MAYEKLDFPQMDWVQGGHPLERKRPAALGGAVLLEFAPGFEDPNWCVNGHAGFVVEGRIGFHLDGGELTAAAGEGFVIDAGTRHRAFNAGRRPVVLFLAARQSSAT